ncbi:MAG: exodeoxyribonuclease VII large subunit [Pseudomonadota bacterium]
MAEKQRAAQAAVNVAEFSVSELSQAIKRSLEDGFGHVRLRGEISGYRGPHASGHCYFGIKDDRAKIDAVIWRGVFSKLKVRPEEGMEVIAHGKITSYPNASKYQIVVESLEPAGVGALMALLEERKRKFQAEGLFDEARKQPIPFLPGVVGIMTSPTGAVIRDMLAGFTERFPTHVILWPVRVQGETSAVEVAEAVRGFNAIAPGGAIPRPDTLIVARGGGSLEDMWGFNDEVVVRAVAESRIPVISAVGHETDWTLIDLVADARAPTPTKAAEWAVPKYSDLVERTETAGARLLGGIKRRLDLARSEYRAAERGLPRIEDLLQPARQRYDAVDHRLASALRANTNAHDRRFQRLAAGVNPRLVAGRLSQYRDRLQSRADRLERAMRTDLTMKQRRFENAAKMLSTLSYQSVLQRGFALVRDASGGMVRTAGSIGDGVRLELEFADGRQSVTADGAKPDASPPPEDKPQAATPARNGVKSKSAREARASRNRQGSLF